MERMTDPSEQTATARATASAVSCPLQVLRKRSEFLATARARKCGMPAFLLQARKRSGTGDCAGIRVGFTCSKKVGNAVARNRAKRRLREIARLILPYHGCDGWDYVLVGRKDVTARRPFDMLLSDLRTALARIHAP